MGMGVETPPLFNMQEITKGEITNRALELIGVVGSLVQADPRKTQTALDALDDVAASLETQGYELGYNFPAEYGLSDVSDDSGLKNWMVMGVVGNLAIYLGQLFGIQPSPSVIAIQQAGMKAISAMTPTIQPNPCGVPYGSANGRRLFAECEKDPIGDVVTIISADKEDFNQE